MTPRHSRCPAEYFTYLWTGRTRSPTLEATCCISIWGCVSVCLCCPMCRYIHDSLQPMDYIVRQAPVHGILQGRILEWVAMLFSRAYSRPQGSNLGFLHCIWVTKEAHMSTCECICLYLSMCVDACDWARFYFCMRVCTSTQACICVRWCQLVHLYICICICCPIARVWQHVC